MVSNLCFETIVEFQGGVETTVTLRYERLFGFCKSCFSLCHDQLHGTSRGDIVEHKREDHYPDEPRQGSWASSYKTATVYGLGDDKEPAKRGIPDQSKGKGKMHDSMNHFGSDYRHNNVRADRKYGEGSRHSRPSSYIPPKDFKKRYVASTFGVDKLKHLEVGHDSLDLEKSLLDVVQGKPAVNAENGSDMSITVSPLGTDVRKGLVFQGDMTYFVEPQDFKMINKEDTNHSKCSDVNFVQSGADENSEVPQMIAVYQKENMATLNVPREMTTTLVRIDGFVAQEEREFESSTKVVNEVDGDIVSDLEEFNGTMVSRFVDKTNDAEKELEEGVDQARVRNKLFKTNPVFIGGISRKRLVHAMISPRKKAISRNSVRIDDGLHSRVTKGTSNPSGSNFSNPE